MRMAKLRRLHRNRLTEFVYESFVLAKIATRIVTLLLGIASLNTLLLFRGRTWLQLLLVCVAVATLSFFVSRMALTSN